MAEIESRPQRQHILCCARKLDVVKFSTNFHSDRGLEDVELEEAFRGETFECNHFSQKWKSEDRKSLYLIRSNLFWLFF